LPPLVQAMLRRKPFERARDRVEAVLATVDEKAM